MHDLATIVKMNAKPAKPEKAAQKFRPDNAPSLEGHIAGEISEAIKEGHRLGRITERAMLRRRYAPELRAVAAILGGKHNREQVALLIRLADHLEN